MTVDYSSVRLIAAMLMFSTAIHVIGAWLTFRSRRVRCAFAVLALAVFLAVFTCDDQLEMVRDSGEEVVEVAESRSIASFESVPGEYVVMERAREDGGLARRSYPVDGTLVYGDAEPGEERVEVVQLSRRVDGEIFGVRVTGVARVEKETRIHVTKDEIEEGL